jgi:hypothetical protein
MRRESERSAWRAASSSCLAAGFVGWSLMRLVLAARPLNDHPAIPVRRSTARIDLPCATAAHGRQEVASTPTVDARPRRAPLVGQLARDQWTLVVGAATS